MGNVEQLKLIYDNIPFPIPENKKKEIAELEFVPLTRIRNNLTFKTFNRLFVLGRAPSDMCCGHPITKWWCICSCEEHNIISVRVNNLTSGNTKSCGCHNLEVAKENIKKAQEACPGYDLTNKTIGNFLVLEKTKEKRYRSPVWRCKCLLCGNDEYYITTNTLMNHTPKSCGCEKRSLGIIKIDNILEQNGIIFSKEKTFPTCRFSDTHAPARFDYWVENLFLIEYDGEQHFEERDLNYFKDNLEKRQEHDRFKTQWCIDNNIPLIRISYKDIDNVNTYEDIFNYIITGKEKLNANYRNHFNYN